METMKQIRAKAICQTCDEELRCILDDMTNLKKAFIECKVKACKARTEYLRLINRAMFYNRISYRICEKYNVVRALNIADFNDLVVFFEC